MISSGLGYKPVAKESINAGSTNITTAAWVEIVAATSQPFSFLEVFNQTTKILKLAVGASGQEQELPVFIYPGIGSQLIPFNEQIKKGQRISARAVDANATTGYLLLNMFG